jgi:beta-lactamase regulating signal transducer with metallopeptidase domain
MDVAFEWIVATPQLAVRAALAAAPLFAMVWLVTRIGRRSLAPRFRHVLWSLVLIRMLIPFGVSSPVGLDAGVLLRWDRFTGYASEGPATHHAVDPQEWQAAASPTASDALLPAPVASPEGFPTAAPPPGSVPSAVWLPAFVFWSGAAAVLLSMTVSTVRLRRRVARAKPFKDATALALLDEGRRLFDIRHPVSLRTVTGLSGPAAYAAWRPAILLPEDAATWSASELRHVVWHELAHIARRDVAANLFVAIVRCAQSWNPLFWWSHREWLAEREAACDAMALIRLGGESPVDYGHTILRFVERLQGAPAAAPGFVWFLDAIRSLRRDRSVRRRLEQLPRWSRPESRGARVFAPSLVAILAAIGLTDAAEPKPVEKPALVFNLPSGTVWTFQPVESSDNALPRVTRRHDISAALARLRRDEPGVPDSVQLSMLVQDIRGLSGPSDLAGPAGVQEAEREDRDRCEAEGVTLVVHARESRQSRIAALLESIARHGLRQVVFEMRIVSTGLSLESLRGSGRIVVGANGGSAPHASSTNFPEPDEVREPVYMHTLDPSAAAEFLDRLLADRNSNTLSAPKVTVFEGMSATVEIGQQRPFVTGLSTEGDRLAPYVSIIPTGLRIALQTTPGGEGSAIRLGVAYLRSDITDVEVLTARSGEKESSIQLPRVTRSLVRGEAELPHGHTLLVAPLRRDEQGRLELCLVTARRLANP